MERIAEVDREGVRATYEGWPSLAREGFRVDVPLGDKPFKRAYILGMGGSAAGGDIIAGWVSDRAGVEVAVFKGQLFTGDMSGSIAVACSASGQTEETIRMMQDAVKKYSNVVAISGGGKMLEVAERLGVPHVEMPKVAAPRYMLPFIVFSTLSILNKGLDLKCEEEAEESFVEMDSEKNEIAPSVRLEDNRAKTLAVPLLDKTPAIYGARVTRGVGTRFKNVLNENSKKHAHFDGIPDAFHNEIEAWEDPRSDFLPIFLRHTSEGARDKERTDRMVGILERSGRGPVQVRGRGRSSLAQLMTLAYRLDMTSYYVSVGLRRDPFPTKLIDAMKKS